MTFDDTLLDELAEIENAFVCEGVRGGQSEAKFRVREANWWQATEMV